MDVSRCVIGLVLGLAGAAAIVVYTVVNGCARRRGALRHWLTGWILGASGMSLMAAGWGILAFAGPRFESRFARGAGAALCATAACIYIASARRVGRWRRPSRYTLELATGGIHGRVRHPQALALCLLPSGLALASGSWPFAATLPLWWAFWTAYTFLEERYDLAPGFGAEYERYRRSTPRLLPRWRRRSADNRR